jgi:hypothetical protein
VVCFYSVRLVIGETVVAATHAAAGAFVNVFLCVCVCVCVSESGNRSVCVICVWKLWMNTTGCVYACV